VGRARGGGGVLTNTRRKEGRRKLSLLGATAYPRKNALPQHTTLKKNGEGGIFFHPEEDRKRIDSSGGGKGGGGLSTN